MFMVVKPKAGRGNYAITATAVVPSSGCGERPPAVPQVQGLLGQ